MSTVTSGANRGSTRTVRKVETPRPLKTSSGETKAKIKPSLSSVSLSGYTIESVDKLVNVMDMVVSAISQDGMAQNSSDECESSLLTSNIAHLCKHLKIFGPQLENSIYQGQLDHACLVFRDAMVRGSLEYAARVHLLEILELRERSWTSQIALPEKVLFNSSNLESDGGFADLSDIKHLVKQYQLAAAGESAVTLSSDEVLRRSTKHRDKPSKMASKNYCKDEIVIRNSDSGKVAPMAKERLVQISGANEDNVSYATRLIGNTIRNNSSPIRELSASDSNSSSEESFADQTGGSENYDYEERLKSSFAKKSKSHSNGNIQPYLYRHKVLVSNCQLTITGDDYTYVTVAKAVLDDYFSKLRQSEIAIEDENNDEVFLNEADSYYSSPLMATEKTCDSFVMSNHGPSIGFEPIIKSTASLCLSEPVFSSQSPETMSANNAMSNMKDLINAEYTFEDGREYEWPAQVKPECKANSDEAPKAFTKEFLLECRNYELSQQSPEDWHILVNKFPGIVKDVEDTEDIIDTIIIE